MFESSVRQRFAVVAFKRTRDGLAIERCLPADDEEHAMRMAERLASVKAGSLAYSRSGNPDFGVPNEPVELGRFGDLPDDALERLLV